jgi:two-component system, LytTR family, response regulator
MAMTDIFRTLIVDDERRARRDLRSLLAQYAEIDIIGEAENITTAVAMIELLKPDLVFLDIQMPGEFGFKLFDHVAVNFHVVFVTAFDSYAIRAFEVNALDYLLKPVNPTRLAQTIARLSKAPAKLPAARDEESEPREPDEKKEKKLTIDDYVFIKEQGNASFVKVAAIVLITALRDYTEVYLESGIKRIVPKPLIEWESTLPAQFFIRVHRSTMINIQFVEKLEDWFNNAYRIHLRTIAAPIISSRRYATKLREKFN